MYYLVTNAVFFIRVLLNLLSCVVLDLSVLLMGAVYKVLIDRRLGHLVVGVMARDIIINRV